VRKNNTDFVPLATAIETVVATLDKY